MIQAIAIVLIIGFNWFPKIKVSRTTSMKLGPYCDIMNRSHLLPILLLTAAFGGMVLSSIPSSSDHNANVKRSFSDLGCMGIYDKAKFARLDRVCEECYQLFRESDVHTLCRSNCFKNSYFSKCVDALLLQNDQERLDSMVEQLYGRR